MSRDELKKLRKARRRLLRRINSLLEAGQVFDPARGHTLVGPELEQLASVYQRLVDVEAAL